MKTKYTLKLLAGLLLLSTLNHQRSTAATLGPAFTYQGRLTDGGLPATNIYDLSIVLCSTATGPGGQVVGSSAVLLQDVPVTNGLFTVTLNNASEFGVSPFDGSARWLEISVRPGLSTGAYTTVLPRQPLLPTPYAIYSGNAAQFGGQGTNAFVAKAGDTMTGTLNLPANGLTLAGSQLVASGGKVGIGTATPQAPLEILSGFGSEALRFGLDPNQYHAISTSFHGSIPGGNYLQFKVQHTTGDIRPVLNLNGDATVTIPGFLGIGTIPPNVPLEIESGFGTEVQRFAFAPNQYHSISTSFHGSIPGGNYLQFKVQHTTGDIRPVLNLNGDATVTVPGFLGIGTIPPSVPLEIESGFGTEVQRFAFAPNEYHSISTSFHGSTPANNYLGFNVQHGTGDIRRVMTLQGDGTVSVGVLQINGADVAEPFNVSMKDLPKGSVVIIDEENPGNVKLSEIAYDQRVAGILSGANGVNSGILLKQQGFNDGGQNVALSGRVYALADASFGAIKPGDLLTTSDTPGHCMIVTDHSRAQGAIIGKAMSSLENGKGMVLVLVSLQ